MTSTAAPAPPTIDGATLFLDGAWTSAQERYERFDAADLTRCTGTFAAATHADVPACRAFDALRLGDARVRETGSDTF